MFKVSETHYAATWLLHENAPDTPMPHMLRERIDRALVEAGIARPAAGPAQVSEKLSHAAFNTYITNLEHDAAGTGGERDE
jgi:hypothetical protein